MTALPRGVALVRIASPVGVVILVSGRLTQKEEERARLAATALGLAGRPIVVLSEAELARIETAALGRLLLGG